MTYNFDEENGDNHYNCPVVAYYPELLKSNMKSLNDIEFMYPYFDLSKRKAFSKKAFKYFKEYIPNLSVAEFRKAVKAAYDAHEENHLDICAQGARAISYARRNGKSIIVLAGRPYHIDPEINHGINQLITSLGLVLITEDSISDMTEPVKVNVLNQWTYHSRLYNAAEYVTKYSDMQLVQLVSFGCGIDAITTDEVSSILTEGKKFYTQLKIDEINNLGAVKIRLRSLVGAMDERSAANE